MAHLLPIISILHFGQLTLTGQPCALILKDRACTEKKGMCNLSFVPIWGSQDPGARDLTVEKTDKPNIIIVKFRYPGNDEKVELKYRLTKTAKGWRISDVSGKDWSLFSILSSPE